MNIHLTTTTTTTAAKNKNKNKTSNKNNDNNKNNNHNITVMKKFGYIYYNKHNKKYFADLELASSNKIFHNHTKMSQTIGHCIVR
jgi:hypothetical protein